MSKEGLNVAKTLGDKLPEFGSPAEAEQELFSRRDRLLAGLQAASISSTVRLDYSPESLKSLERWYFRLLRRQEFESIGVSRETFEQAISMYLGAVFVANRPAFKWIVEEYAFASGRYEIGVARPMFSLMLGIGRNLEAAPKNTKQESLWELFTRFSG